MADPQRKPLGKLARGGCGWDVCPEAGVARFGESSGGECGGSEEAGEGSAEKIDLALGFPLFRGQGSVAASA